MHEIPFENDNNVLIRNEYFIHIFEFTANMPLTRNGPPFAF